MKRRIFIMVIICGLSVTAITAQQHIEALIKKCETIQQGINMEVIKRKNKVTGNKEIAIINISIDNNASLIEEFINAFGKDESDADETVKRTIDKKDENKTDENIKRTIDKKEQYYRLKFENGTTYTLKIIKANKEYDALITKRTSLAGYEVLLNGFNYNDSSDIMDALTNSKIKLDSLLLIQKDKADSLIKLSTKTIRRINWDSLAEVFADKMDSVTNKIEWENLYLERSDTIYPRQESKTVILKKSNK